jgi:hypothetical protein
MNVYLDLGTPGGQDFRTGGAKGGKWEVSLRATWGPEWTRSYHTKEGFQVSERGIEKGARGISKGKKRARGLRHVHH